MKAERGGKRRRSRLTFEVVRSLSAGVAYLVRLQHPRGSWSDFWLPVGTSDEWVTAYTGLALDAVVRCPLVDRTTRDAALASVGRTVEWLRRRRRPSAGWGYNATVPPDADSTAHALALQGRTGVAVPDEAVAFLRAHEVPGRGFRTYRWRDPDHDWTRPCADVTAAALRALHDCGVLDQAELRTRWVETFGATRDARGWWHGYWWTAPSYPTGLVLEVWALAGRPPLASPERLPLPAETAFDLAWAIQAETFGAVSPERAGAFHDGTTRRGADADDRIDELVRRLVEWQAADGGWPCAPVLRVPPSHPKLGTPRLPILARDARRVFVTASAVRALAIVAAAFADDREGEASVSPGAVGGFTRTPTLSLWERGQTTERGPHRLAPSPGVERGGTVEARRRSALGHHLDDLVRRVAAAVGFGESEAAAAAKVFAVLTRESLAEPCPWPAAQLSSLAGGSPLEFSATVGDGQRSALRYATEVGNPYLAPYERARSGLDAVAGTARYLGYTEAWRRVEPAIGPLVAPEFGVPEGLRFWVWSGIDQEAPGGGRGAPGLKVYLNLLNAEVGRTRERIEAALRLAEIPRSNGLAVVLDLLDEAGFPHELGFGLGPGGSIACKVYYELDGWHRSLVRRLLRAVGFDADPDVVCPEIPGILRESLAAKSRAGIAVRVEPETGVVRDLTVAAAFPAPLVAHEEIGRRVERWIDANGWDGATYRALRATLLPAWLDRGGSEGRLHSLFTRTVGTRGAWTSVYMRPSLGWVWGNRAKGTPD